MNHRSPDMLKPTLIAGLLFGVLGAVPVVNWINCACCALIVACGVFASYLYSGECRRQGAEFRPGNGALVGLVAGAFYAMASTLVGAIFRMLIGDRVAKMALEWIRNMPNLPAENRDMIEKFLEQAGAFGVLQLVLGFVLTLVVAAIFSTLGGLLGGALFKVAPPPAPPAFSGDLGPPPPPPPSTPAG